MSSNEALNVIGLFQTTIVLIQVDSFMTMDVKRNPENRISVLEMKFGSTSSANEIRIYFFLSLSSRKLHKNYQMSGKLIHTFV